MPSTRAWTEAQLQTRLKTRILHEWVWTTAALLVLTFSLSYFGDKLGLQHLDNTLYDHYLSTLVHHPPSDDIIIVVIDDSSIQELGLWPWRRARHAQVLQRLGGARAVALDLLLSEQNPAWPADDFILADAIRKHGRVVLPFAIGDSPEAITAPLPVLAEAAAGLGYIGLRADPDGVVRSFSAQKRTPAGGVVDHLSLKLLKVGSEHQQIAKLQDLGTESRRIAYAGAPGNFAMVPYNRVADGGVPASAFKDKFVLIGSWGSGLGDTVPTPHSHNGDAMSGVEVLANILNGGLTNRWIDSPGRLAAALLCLFPVLISCLSFRRLSPQRGFVFSVALFAGTLVMTGLLLRYGLWWVSPVAALIGIVLAYPVWSWRSQHAALRHIDHELALLGSSRHTPSPDQPLLTRLGQLHRAIEQMRIAQRQRNETLRFLSHDMRAPLNSIVALAELQREGRQHTDGILRQFDHYARKTLSLVDGFVALGRAEAIDLHLQPVDMSDLITQCCEDAWVHAHQKQINVQYDNLPTHAWVNADAHFLERAWSNLLDNALKYSAAGTTIVCALEREADYWVAQIQDQGRGMDPAAMKGIFSPFVRIDEQTPENPDGAGLGLAFVHAVVTRHGGWIQVESEPDQGTRFRIGLPAVDEIT